MTELYRNVDVREFGIQLEGADIASMRIPSGYVPNGFIPHMLQHVITPGENLENGHVVVLADDVYRTGPDILDESYKVRNPGFRGATSHDRLRVMETSRWAIVTRLTQKDNVVYFDALYADGTIIPRHYNKTIKWAVLKAVEVIPNFEIGKTREVISGLIEDHLAANGENSAAGESAEEPAKSTNFTKLLRDATTLKQVKNIMKQRRDYFEARHAEENIEVKTCHKNADQIRLNDTLALFGGEYYVEFVTESRGSGIRHARSREITINARGIDAQGQPADIEFTLKPMDLVEVYVRK